MDFLWVNTVVICFGERGHLFQNACMVLLQQTIFCNSTIEAFATWLCSGKLPGNWALWVYESLSCCLTQQVLVLALRWDFQKCLWLKCTNKIWNCILNGNVAHLIYNKIEKQISIVNIIIIAFEVLYLDFIRARGANMWIVTLSYVNPPKMKCEGELDCDSYTFNQVKTEHSQCIQSHSSEP